MYILLVYVKIVTHIILHSCAQTIMSIRSQFKRPPLRGSHENNSSNFDEPDQTKTDHQDDRSKTTRSFVILGLIFLSALCIMVFVYISFPKLDLDEVQYMKLPRDIEDAKALGRVLSRYSKTYYLTVMVAFFTTYIFLQTFAIPGSIFLSILSGFLFPFPLALLMVCLCSAIGAANCYLLSYLVGVRLVMKYIPDKVESWSSTVANQRHHLLNYIIFLRITPFLPNWFINITSPVLKVPITPFFIGTFLGVAPPSFVAIQAGTTLYQLSHYGDAVSWTSVIVLAILAIVSILPVILKNRLGKKFE